MSRSSGNEDSDLFKKFFYEGLKEDSAVLEDNRSSKELLLF